MKTTYQGITINDATWQKFRQYQESLWDIDKKPLTFKTWLKRYENFNTKRKTR